MTRLLALVLSVCSAYGAFAAGAIAVGEPADVAKEGLAVGIVVNYASEAKAAETALANCRSYKDAPQSTRDACKVVKTFMGECVATAYDPKPSTPGWGWSIGFTKDVAADVAMANCRLSAGVDRARYCAAATTMCDVKQGE
jgi:hypothetical protein